MSIVAPKGRKHLSADALFRLVRNGFAGIPDHRAEEMVISHIPSDLVVDNYPHMLRAARPVISR